MEGRKMKITLGKSGAGSISPKLALPITDLRDMGITEEDREIIYYYDKENKQIILKKSK